MPITKKEIIEFKKDMVGRRHGKRLEEQRIDQTFFDDTYPLLLIKDSKYQIRTGFVAGMVNGVTNQLVKDVPRVYTKPRKDTATSKEAAARVAAELNRWARYLSFMPSNPYRQSFKNKLVRGEDWIYVVHNEFLAKYDGKWQTDFPDMMPVRFIRYDPLVVFADPSEEVDLLAKRVVVPYRRSAGDIAANYPNWRQGKHADSEKLDFLFYFDEDLSYAQVGNDEELFWRDNPYGICPFIHGYSGWGIEDQEKSPDLLAFSRVRMSRDKIIEGSSISSDFAYSFHMFAHKHQTLINRSGEEMGPNILKEYRPRPDALSVLTIPPGAELQKPEDKFFDAPAFAYASMVRQDLMMEYPGALRGIPSGSSGRQEDLQRSAGLALYDSPVDSTNNQWAKAMEVGLKIAYKIPDMIPPNLKPNDINQFSQIEVDVRTDDPIERDRKLMAGRTMVVDGLRSIKSFLEKDVGMTEEEAEDEVAEILAEKYLLGSPDIAAFIGAKVAEKSGMADELNAYKEAMGGETGKSPLESGIGNQGGPPRRGNIKTQTGLEQSDVGMNTMGTRRTGR
uniref:Portal protein n=1 Tax=viral metagenome TaxID=1070528 RepID=A0A6M3KZ29_9ZZZZ